jgi:hypothetical protein
MAWRVAKSLATLRDQVNALYPNRSKSSDGTVGDAAHAATKSDHNPNSDGVVTAMDITHDPAHGLDARRLAETLVASRDKRIKYIISNAQIISSQVSPWVWRPYNGINAHRAHVHISVDGNPSLYDDARPWTLSGKVAPPKTGPKYRSLVNGYFSSPEDNTVKPSIWSNNPGAINGANKNGAPVRWVQDFPGFVKTVVIGGGNPIAVFETPEQGLALFWTLLKRYRDPAIWNPPVTTVQGIVNRYGGGQDYSEYVKFVCSRTGFPPDKVIDLSDNAVLVPFAKAMFRYEAGVETPLSDAQIRYGFDLARKGGASIPVVIGGGAGAAAGGIASYFGMSIEYVIPIAIAIAIGVGILIFLKRRHNP